MEKKLKESIEALSSGPVRQYILDHENDDVAKVILKNKVILGLPTERLLEQIVTRRKAKEKLPLYYDTPGVIFPPPANFEQSSSQATALYKARIVSLLVGNIHPKGADLTGGFGVDTYFLSKISSKIDFIEPDRNLLEIARHDHALLGASNIQYHSMAAAEFIGNSTERYDFIYADPSRRTVQKKKIYSLEDSDPDIVKLSAEIFSRTSCLLVKASPLLDIQAGASKLPFVKTVFVISVRNECKEIIFHCDKAYQDEPVIKAINIQSVAEPQAFEFYFSEERHHVVSYADPLKYLYEPNASILKAGAFKSIAVRYGLRKLHASTHLYTSDQLIDMFPGRRFAIEALIRPEASEIKKKFPDMKANVSTRNYPLTPVALKKKTGLKDGGEKFLIGFSGQRKKFLAVATKV